MVLAFCCSNCEAPVLRKGRLRRNRARPNSRARFWEGEAPAEPHNSSANGSAGASPSRRPTPRITRGNVSRELCHREAVKHHSPGSRSAPWVSVPPPKFKPRRGFTNGRLVLVPRGPCETPSGFAATVRSGTQSALRDSGLCCLTPSAYISGMTSANLPSPAPMVNKDTIKSRLMNGVRLTDFNFCGEKTLD